MTAKNTIRVSPEHVERAEQLVVAAADAHPACAAMTWRQIVAHAIEMGLAEMEGAENEERDEDGEVMSAILDTAVALKLTDLETRIIRLLQMGPCSNVEIRRERGLAVTGDGAAAARKSVNRALETLQDAGLVEPDDEPGMWKLSTAVDGGVDK